MKRLIYISGILGGLLLMIGLIGIITDFNYNAVFFISGLALIILIFIPLSVIEKYKHTKKIKSIIKSNSDKASKHNSISSGKSEIKGWSMNNSPFRKRKSGLNWGGGNIHGANASRGTR
ncbi:MAG: hypothetical protein A2W99_05320 [Bacteroidetes bacterium GWF2_33_16]|nr:MAG: hypothetical protein A2X00_17840 [Bacteroidetes bacterium GWE2_32_14]OFY06082.1 MAG: hypothetical protein A2W99_05320 [Bacteroidetes bacterium GWF2_33_16]